MLERWDIEGGKAAIHGRSAGLVGFSFEGVIFSSRPCNDSGASSTINTERKEVQMLMRKLLKTAGLMAVLLFLGSVSVQPADAWSLHCGTQPNGFPRCYVVY